MGESLPDGILKIDALGPIIRVWYARSARDIPEARAVLAAIDAALDARGFELLLLDSRDADRTAPDVQREIWAWLSGHRRIRKVATLMHSAALARNIRLEGAGQGVMIRAFKSEPEAAAWLRER